ncbi:MAG: FecR domain-containing protein [Pseudobacter sp.]|uniref:FecR domain-containing protein n=1 Tax=Pseudobacter sp. TaxID=2045420 RepID=UPI003F7EF75E
MTQDRLSYLFERCLSQSATPAERDEWIAMAAMPEHENIVNELLSKAYDEAEPADQPDQATSNSILSAIFGSTELRPEPRRIFFLRQWKIVAAAALLIVVSTILLVVYSNRPVKKNSEDFVHANQILPGQKGAILTLADGTQVALDTIKNAVVALENGVTAKVNNGSLMYEGDGDVVAYNTMSTPNGRQFQLTLPDGTRVWLNAASSIRYPTSFKENNRRVEVTGEAYFEVAKNPSRTFVVDVNRKTEVEVLGTEFNVNAYDNEADLRTTLISGAVLVSAGPTAEKIRMRPGQQVRFSNNGLQVFENVAVANVVAWKNWKFNFEGKSFVEICRELERWYNIEIVFEGGIPEKSLWGGMSMDVPLSGVLQYFKGLDIRYREEGRKLIIMP